MRIYDEDKGKNQLSSRFATSSDGNRAVPFSPSHVTLVDISEHAHIFIRIYIYRLKDGRVHTNVPSSRTTDLKCHMKVPSDARVLCTALRLLTIRRKHIFQHKHCDDENF